MEQTEQILFIIKFGLGQITLRRNGLPIVHTPITTQDHKRLLFITLSAMGVLQQWDNYQQYFNMSFDLTSTQQAAHDLLRPEVTNCSGLLDLQFSNPFPISQSENG